MTASEVNVDVETHSIDCPRCGYDQRGVIVTWQEWCPLEGVCSECGLSFTWHEVLRRDQLAPKWSVEFTPRRRGLPLATLKTFVRTLWPWGFWKRMNMAYAIHWLRIAAYLLILLTPMLAGYVAAQSIAATIVLSRFRAEFNAQGRQLPALIARVQTMPPPSQFRGIVLPLPSMRIAVSGWGEVWRSRTLAALQQELLTPTHVEHSYAAAIIEAVFTPRSQESSGQIVSPAAAGGAPSPTASTRSFPYPIAPADVWAALVAPSGGMWGPFSNGYGRGAWHDVAPAMSAALFWTLMLLVPFPLSLALLPITRRKAKVRWAHIGRVSAYSVAIPIVFAELTVTAWLSAKLALRISNFEEEALMVPVALGMPLVVMCFWGAAIKKYLRLPHATAVTILLSVLCVLAVGGTVFWGGQWLFG